MQARSNQGARNSQPLNHGKRTKRASVTIPQITESNTTRRLREKNKKIVKSMNRKGLFNF